MEESSQTKKPNTRIQVEKLVRFNDKNDDHSTKWYVTNNFELSLLRLSPDGHLPEWREQRNSC
ncbi:22192_t:CDS:1, partial [Gigaspora rosea]